MDRDTLQRGAFFIMPKNRTLWLQGTGHKREFGGIWNKDTKKENEGLS
jgi:hypothetical protein